MLASAACPLAVTCEPASPLAGAKPGTSGLRKKTAVFMADNGAYLRGFTQALFDALPAGSLRGATLVVGGDGRFFTRPAVQHIVRIAAAQGVARLRVGAGGLLSTPAVSALIRAGGCAGGIILTASHNPGGEHEDFGIKYNCANGGPAPEALTDAAAARAGALRRVLCCAALPDVDLDALGTTRFAKAPAPGAAAAGEAADAYAAVSDEFCVEVVDPVAEYAALLERIFDFGALRAFVARPDFAMVYDAMSGVAGPYGRRVLCERLGVPPGALLRCTPLPDFGGHHPDPNLTYATDLVARMGVRADGTPAPGAPPPGAPPQPDFGAAQDGDADRNMILGRRFFVTPSDSVAVIAANAHAIPFFARGLRAVARSMPTSAALDRVAAAKGLQLFEVPTGWKFFGNLMDSSLLGGADYTPFLCGEESFGTGSNHVREKDGLWAVLAWLSILADANAATPVGALRSVEDVVRAHWATYGRNYYCRYDYEGVDAAAGDAVMAHLRARVARFAAAAAAAAGAAAAAAYTEALAPGFDLATADEFRYVDPVDHSVSERQGLRFIAADGSRVVFRLSGTGSVGATVRVYIERYTPPGAGAAALDLATADALKDLVAVALELSQMERLTGRTAPTVIT